MFIRTFSRTLLQIFCKFISNKSTAVPAVKPVNGNRQGTSKLVKSEIYKIVSVTTSELALGLSEMAWSVSIAPGHPSANQIRDQETMPIKQLP